MHRTVDTPQAVFRHPCRALLHTYGGRLSLKEESVAVFLRLGPRSTMTMDLEVHYCMGNHCNAH